MALTKIEEYIFDGNRVHIVKAFNFEGNQVTVTFAPRDDESLDGNADVTATFPDAAMRSIWGDPDQVTERRLDIIGFDSKPSGTRWQFVLNCDTMEWEWESDWPTLSRAHPAE